MLTTRNKKHIFNKKTRDTIIITILFLTILHVATWLVAYFYPTNRVLVDIYGRLGMDSELSLPTWITSILWFCFAALCFIVAKQQKSKSSRLAWSLLVIVGLVGSIDETIAIHELLLQGLHILADFGEGRQTLLANSWLFVLPVLLLIAFIVLSILKKNIPKDTQKQLFMAFAIFALGAFVMEYISIPFDKSLSIYAIGVVVIEESLEIAGVMLAVTAVLNHIHAHEPKIKNALRGLIT